MHPLAHLSIVAVHNRTQQRSSLPFAFRLAMALVLTVLVALVLLAADVSVGLQVTSGPLSPPTDFFGE